MTKADDDDDDDERVTKKLSVPPSLEGADSQRRFNREGLRMAKR